MKKLNLEKSKEKIRELYFDKGKSLRFIASEIGASMGTIRKNMVLWGFKRRPTTKRELNKLSKDDLDNCYNVQKLTLDKIAMKEGVATSTVFRWMNEMNIPARKYKYEKHNFSEDPKEREYICGLAFGDFHTHKHSRQILTELTTTHPAMIQLFYSIFEKYGSPKKYIKHNKILGRNEWKTYVLLNDSFKFMLEKEFDVNNEYFYDFLAGFFDAEGCLYLYDNKGYIGLSGIIYNSNKRLLKIIKQRLERDGFHPKMSICSKNNERTTNNYFRGTDVWAVRLHTNKEVLRLMKAMPIRHQEKIDKLRIAVSAKGNKWEEIEKQINDLRTKIKGEVKEYINNIPSK
ncbi:MAG: LAGLIDADG family homing endonuclease [Nanoarchaeota archaeon]|nr:LAGLIDADG family homing endonuclease [Nanoarchaeota archaeon]